MFSRAKIAAFLDQAWVRNGVIGVILFNAVLLGMETSRPLMDAPARSSGAGQDLPWHFRAGTDAEALRLSRAILALGLERVRLHHHRRRAGARDPRLQRAAGLAHPALLRVVSVSPSLRRVVEGFISALPGMGSVFLLMGMIFYIASVMATKLFQNSFPQWFGDLGAIRPIRCSRS